MSRKISLANGEEVHFDESHDVQGQPLLKALVRKDVGMVRLVRKPDIVADVEAEGPVLGPQPARGVER